LTAAVRRTLLEENPEISLQFRVFSSMLQESLLRERLMATLSGFFGFLAMVLATVGLYGVISYMVARRRGEIGIRMALGANRGNVLGLVLREAGMLLAVGLLIGTGLAIAAARTTSSMLFGLKPTDPLTIGLSVGLLAVVAMAASFLPAMRAARLEPMLALREE
jgi:putative ABC transport system permease protein